MVTSIVIQDNINIFDCKVPLSDSSTCLEIGEVDKSFHSRFTLMRTIWAKEDMMTVKQPAMLAVVSFAG